MLPVITATRSAGWFGLMCVRGGRRTKGAPMDSRSVLTVDVEDWFHILEIEGGYTRSDWSGLESPVVAAVARAAGHVRGQPAKPVVRLPASDASRWRALGIPGEDGSGVWTGTDFLELTNRG